MTPAAIACTSHACKIGETASRVQGLGIAWTTSWNGRRVGDAGGCPRLKAGVGLGSLVQVGCMGATVTGVPPAVD